MCKNTKTRKQVRQQVRPSKDDKTEGQRTKKGDKKGKTTTHVGYSKINQ